ncbi:MAG: isopentenyl-diphosphate Delta-isomerase [Pseudomonadota bacterium]
MLSIGNERTLQKRAIRRAISSAEAEGEPQLLPELGCLDRARPIPDLETMQTLEQVILVDERDRETGFGEKHEVHRQGALHRAFSVIVWNSSGELLLQKRHAKKYHSGGLWTNACCGHQRPGEDNVSAAVRRLEQEMGFVCPLEALGTIRYHAKLDHGMTEHEIVHVFRGIYDGEITPHPDEAEDYQWTPLNDIQADALAEPERYTIWFRRYLNAGWPVSVASPAS